MSEILNTDLQGAIQSLLNLTHLKPTVCLQAARKEHNEKCISSWKLAGAGSADDMGETVGTKFGSGDAWQC